MTIDEAIKRLVIIEELMATDFSSEDADAIKLGIEALLVIQRRRKAHAVTVTALLPGESK